MVQLNNESLAKIKFESGKYQYKILDQYNYTKGSAMLLHYRNRYFAVTCNHCLKHIDEPTEIAIPILFENGRTKAFNLRNYKNDKDMDLAAFEISYVNMEGTQNDKGYIEENIIDDIDTEPIKFEEDLIILHGTNFFGAEREEKEGHIEFNFTTTPYFTVILNYENDFFEASIDTTGIGEDGQMHNVETLSGMSGSPVFRIHECDEIKWIGILSNGDPKSGICYVLDYKQVLGFIDSNYFSK